VNGAAEREREHLLNFEFHIHSGGWGGCYCPKGFWWFWKLDWFPVVSQQTKDGDDGEEGPTKLKLKLEPQAEDRRDRRDEDKVSSRRGSIHTSTAYGIKTSWLSTSLDEMEDEQPKSQVSSSSPEVYSVVPSISSSHHRKFTNEDQILEIQLGIYRRTYGCGRSIRDHEKLSQESVIQRMDRWTSPLGKTRYN